MQYFVMESNQDRLFSVKAIKNLALLISADTKCWLPHGAQSVTFIWLFILTKHNVRLLINIHIINKMRQCSR